MSDSDTVWTESALEKIAQVPELLKALVPELSLFISQHASNLSEFELLRLVTAIHGNQALVKVAMDLYDAGTFNLARFQRNTLDEKELTSSMNIYWHPEEKGNVTFFYQDFPKLELWRLFMDGCQQKEGWSAYEGGTRRGLY